MLSVNIQQSLFTVEGRALLNVNVDFKDGELICLRGASGIGKSTLLRIIAGLTKPDSGRVLHDSDVWCDTDAGVYLPANVRRAGLMFQDFALFPNMTVEQQIRYAQPVADSSEMDRLLESFDIKALRSRRPHQLSGGQRQRVAMARAIASKPSLLLLDEPFSALDFELKESVMESIRYAHELLGTTTLLVCHDPHDIERMADKILHFSFKYLHVGSLCADGLAPTKRGMNLFKKNDVCNSLVECRLIKNIKNMPFECDFLAQNMNRIATYK